MITVQLGTELQHPVPTKGQPQQCPQCPAKFSRKTHLNRHLRSHLDERTHVCEVCNAKFTRSDLLKRHKKVCGQVTRSRRKSCEACARSKVKCNLQTPCERCTNRGIACHFTTNPNISRAKSDLRRSRKQRKHVVPDSLTNSPAPSSISALSAEQASNLTEETQSEPITAQEEPFTFDLIGSFTMDQDLDYFKFCSLEESSMFTGETQQSDDYSWTVGIPLPLAHELPASISPEEFCWQSDTVVESAAQPQLLNSITQCDSSTKETSDHQLYLNLFFSTFSRHLPIIHEGAWRADDKPAVLLRVMQACGAIFCETPQASQFVLDTLETARGEIIQEFVYQTSDPTQQIYLILAIALVQILGLFHTNASVRQNARIGSGMLKMMIARMGLLETLQAWNPKDPRTDDRSLEDFWESWVQYETAKRVCCLAHLLECNEVVFFGTSTASGSTFDGYLPSDDSLWNAGTAKRWASLLGATMPWDCIVSRLRGQKAQAAIASLISSHYQPSFGSFTAFAGVVILRTLLARISSQIMQALLGGDKGAQFMDQPGSPSEFISNMKSALHRWSSKWNTQATKSAFSGPVLFVRNSMPFYRLAEALLSLLENPTTVLTPWASALMDAEIRFRALRAWWSLTRLGSQVVNKTYDAQTDAEVLCTFLSNQALQSVDPSLDARHTLVVFFVEY